MYMNETGVQCFDLGGLFVEYQDLVILDVRL